MVRQCLLCDHTFDANESLEYLPRGSRVAYDPTKGRLWVICPGCKRWTLVPIESRWEALEELEKLTTDEARLLSQTENISLFRARRLEIVRVGRAQLPEEAWWRYGRELQERRDRFKKLSTVGAVGAGAAIAGSWATGGLSFMAAWFLWDRSPTLVTDGARWLRFGGKAWRGRRECQRCGHTFGGISYSDREGLILQPGRGRSGSAVVKRCPRCNDAGEGGLHLQGLEGRTALRRLLAYHHFSGASERRVKEATRLIEVAGGPEQVATKIIRDGRRLGDLGRIGSIALEIASNEERERQLLEMELAELERHWAEEEELAEIIDGELTPLPFVETLRRRITGRSDPRTADLKPGP